MLKVFTSFFCLLFCFFHDVSVASEEISEQDDVVMEVLLHAPSSIEKICDHKIILRADKVSLHQGRIYIETEDGDVIFLPVLFSDESGLYLKTAHGKTKKMWICKKCTRSYNYDPGKCESCGGTDFLIRYRS